MKIKGHCLEAAAGGCRLILLLLLFFCVDVHTEMDSALSFSFQVSFFSTHPSVNARYRSILRTLLPPPFLS